MKRRDFVKIMGTAVGGLAIPLDLSIGSRSSVGHPDPGWAPGREAFINSTCGLCPGGCGITCRVVDGSLVSVRGNAFNPINRGGVCPNGMAGVQLVYSPDRVKGPMVRDGDRGSEKWRSISWHEGLSILRDRLLPLKGRVGGGKTVFLSGISSGSKAEVIHAFMQTIDGEIYLDDRMDANPHVFSLMHGVDRYPAFDLEQTDLVFSFGADLLGAWWSPLQAQTSFGGLMTGRGGRRGEWVQAEHRLSSTGAQASEWVPVFPGSYGALALGMAYILIKEELYDHDFISQRTMGFESWSDESGNRHIGLRDLILQFYHPEEVSRLTGIDEGSIIRLGKKFGSAETAIAVGDHTVSYNTNGLYALMAVHTLNLLKGNVNRPGGITVQGELPLSPLSGLAGVGKETGDGRSGYLAAGGIAFESDFRRIERFPERVLWESDRDVDLLFISGTNPVFSQVDHNAFEEALKKVGYIVSFSSFIDETSHFADLILPDHMSFEKWGDAVSPPTFPYPVWALVKPVVSPIHDTRNTGDILLELIRELRGSAGGGITFEDMKDLLRYRAKGLYEAQRGMIIDDPFERMHTGNLETRGWWTRSRMTFDDFWNRLVERGGWCDPFIDWDNWDAVCRTRSKKVHFFIQDLGEREGNELASFPHHEGPDVGTDSEYPYLLVPYRMSKIDGGESGRIPWVIESSGPMAQLIWDSWVEVGPEIAAKAGLESGDMAWVESKRGRIRLKTKITEGIVDGVLSIPVGFGHKYGTWANIGSNVLQILQGDQDTRTGLPSWQTTAVKITKA
jgi:anaerobic selenocysteine-containing dehydrogenase